MTDKQTPKSPEMDDALEIAMRGSEAKRPDDPMRAETGAATDDSAQPGEAPVNHDRWGGLRRAARHGYDLPVIGYPLAWLSALLRLPRRLAALQAAAEAAEQRITTLQTEAADIRRILAEMTEALTAQREALSARTKADEGRLDAANAEIDRLIRRVDEHRLVLDHYLRGETGDSAEPQTAAADDLQDFLVGLEARYRGSEEEIAERLASHLPRIDKALEAAGALPVLDLGCGRGDWLGLLAVRGHAAIGVDLSGPAIATAREKGHQVVEADALDYLSSVRAGSLAAVTAFHLAEHLPFGRLLELVRRAKRALAPGGLLLIETPNPANLIVGAHTFWIDPTHQRPLAPELMRYVLEAEGFVDIDIDMLTPADDYDNEAVVRLAENERLNAIARERFLGPRDYAVSGIAAK